MKFLSEKLLSNKQIYFFIVLTICINAIGLFSQILLSNDSNYYAIIAKNIVLSKDWINLTFNHHDWLDKPHMQFWITAFFYKIFGINPFAYILPGFIFNLIGAYYTYLLAKKLFSSQEVGILSSLLYLTCFHLMSSSIDVRQEAFLLGEIMPSVYYWYLYDEYHNINKNYLFAAAFFTALAIMTKGVFVLVTIFSGLFFIWILKLKFKNFISKKWLIAFFCCFIFILPELIVLYIQFDLHPQKIIYGKLHTSGIRWFFWDSQFGRFFNFGPISNTHKDMLSHYFYFLHTFLWAFLPWSIIFIIACINIYKSLKLVNNDLPNSTLLKQLPLNYGFLLASFVFTFLMFSLTKFQLDHYINIIYPFGLILCADWLYNKATRFAKHPVFNIQLILALVILITFCLISIIITSNKLFIILMIIAFIICSIYLLLMYSSLLTKAVVYPILAIYFVFIVLISANSIIYKNFDLGYQVTQTIKTLDTLPIIDYDVNSLSLEFLSKSSYTRLNTREELLEFEVPCYLVINENNWKDLQNAIKVERSYKIINSFSVINQNQFIPSLFSKTKKDQSINRILLIKIS